MMLRMGLFTLKNTGTIDCFVQLKAAEKAFLKVNNKSIEEYNDYLLSLGFRLFKITICQELK